MISCRSELARDALNAPGERRFFEPVRGLLDHAVKEGFMNTEHRDMLIVDSDPVTLIDALERWQAPTVTKWIGAAQDSE